MRHRSDPAPATPTEPVADGLDEAARAVLAEHQNVTFTRKLRGYDRDEVDLYVDRVANALAYSDLQLRHAVEIAARSQADQSITVLATAEAVAVEIEAGAHDQAAQIVAAAEVQASEVLAHAERIHAERIAELRAATDAAEQESAARIAAATEAAATAEAARVAAEAELDQVRSIVDRHAGDLRTAAREFAAFAELIAPLPAPVPQPHSTIPPVLPPADYPDANNVYTST